MAKLVITKYQGDSGIIHALRCLSAVKAVSGNTEPTGAVNSDVLPKISKNLKEYGIRPRFLSLTRTAQVGSDPADLKTYRTKMPVLTVAQYNDFSKGSSVAFNGNTWVISRKAPEDY